MWHVRPSTASSTKCSFHSFGLKWRLEISTHKADATKEFLWRCICILPLSASRRTYKHSHTQKHVHPTGQAWDPRCWTLQLFPACIWNRKVAHVDFNIVPAHLDNSEKRATASSEQRCSKLALTLLSPRTTKATRSKCFEGMDVPDGSPCTRCW